MAEVGIRELLEAGVHFGHQTRRWNPKMRRFIHGERGGIYIIDLLKTRAPARAGAGVRRRRSPTAAAPSCSSAPRSRPATPIKEVAEAAGMPYVNHRWLGGLLTNFQTISQRIKRLHDLERYETEGQLALLPTRERMAAQADLAKLRANLGGVKNMQRAARRDVRDRPQDRGDRRPRGPAPAHPDHRPGRHQLRPRRHRLRHPRQRRRDPLVRADHAGDRRRRRRGPRACSAPRRSAPRQEAEERARAEAEERAKREAEEQAKREAEERRAPAGATQPEARGEPRRRRRGGADGGAEGGQPPADPARRSRPAARPPPVSADDRKRRRRTRRRRRRGRTPEPADARRPPRPRPSAAAAASRRGRAADRQPPSRRRTPRPSGAAREHRRRSPRRTSRPCATAPARG